MAASKNYKFILKLKKREHFAKHFPIPINEIQISKLPKQGKMMLPKLLLLSSMKVLSGLEKAIQIARASWVPRNKNINLAKLTTRAEVSLSSFIGGRQSSSYTVRSSRPELLCKKGVFRKVHRKTPVPESLF